MLNQYKLVLMRNLTHQERRRWYRISSYSYSDHLSYSSKFSQFYTCSAQVIVLPCQEVKEQEVVDLVDSSQEEEVSEDTLATEDSTDDVVLEREVRLECDGRVVVREGNQVEEDGGKDLEAKHVETNVTEAEQDDVEDTAGNESDEDTSNTDVKVEVKTEPSEGLSRRRNSSPHDKDGNMPRSRRSARSRSRYRSRSRRRRRSISRTKRRRSRSISGRMSHETKDEEVANLDFVVVDSTEIDEEPLPPGEEQDDDIIDMEVIKSNMAMAEGSRRRSRSRSRSRSSRRRRVRSRSRNRERSRKSLEDWRRRVEQERKEEERSRRRRREERRKDEAWREQSDAFLARLGVAGGEAGFHRPPPSLPAAAPASFPPCSSSREAGGRRRSQEETMVSPWTLAQPPPEMRQEVEAGGRIQEQEVGGRRQEQEAGGRSSHGQDLDLRYSEILRPGNYLLVTWDMISLGGALLCSCSSCCRYHFCFYWHMLD